MKKGSLKYLLGLLFLCWAFNIQASNIYDFDLSYKKVLIGDQSLMINFVLKDQNGSLLLLDTNDIRIFIGADSYNADFHDGKCQIVLKDNSQNSYYVKLEGFDHLKKNVSIKRYPAFLSIVPPLVAIIVAIIFKEVIIALFIGIILGIILIFDISSLQSWLRAPFVFVDHYAINVITNPEKASIIVFSLLIGGMVGLLMKNGSMFQFVNRITKFISTRQKSLFTTWLLGIFIFFDDYANTLVVGNSVRPLTDKYKVSREKLAYIVDSTAAPVASIALITTWIGAQINYISDAVVKLNIDENPYLILLNSIKYAFYPFLTLAFIFFLTWMKRDFGPMFKSEKLAIKDFSKSLEIHSGSSQVNENENQIFYNAKWFDAIIPILGLMGLAFASLLFYTGSSDLWNDSKYGFWLRLMNVIGSSDPYSSLLYASIFGLALALVITCIRKGMKLQASINAVVEGFKSMNIAIIILILAWSLGMITEDLGTDIYLSEIIGQNVPIVLLSSIVFIAAALISFATGSSWGTMALLYPILLSTSYQTCMIHGLDHDAAMTVFYMVVAAVLGGSVFGDHCSPISDTTILSSMASGCNHIQHVKTQIPYAVSVGVMSVIVGYLLSSIMNWSPLWSLLISIIVIIVTIRFVGKKIEQ